jgi:glucose/arabinose dehydrogenase
MLRGAPIAVACTMALLACGSGGSANDTDAGATANGTPAADGSARAAAGVRLVPVGEFEAPLYVTAPPRDKRRVMVVEQGGVIRVVRGGRILSAPFLDISRQVTAGGEMGLLGLAFAPDYASSGLFYVYFSDREGDQRIVEYRRASADRANPGSARTVLVMADSESNHNGGDIKFGPDRMLYVGTGDGGGAGDQHGVRGNGQSLSTLLGKLLRIDPRASGGRPYTVPSGNPFAGDAGRRGEIYSYGLRNPWRFSFDRASGDLVIADVGQNAVEEVNFVRRGGARGVNFGWRVWEGRKRYSRDSTGRVKFPVIQQQHSDGWCSITGGYIVRDPKLPALRGRYVYGDFCKGQIYSAKLTTIRARNNRALSLPRVENLSSFGEDASGRVYVTSLSGPVYRLAAR